MPKSILDGIELVANIGGNHHLLSFTAGGNPEINVFDAQLRLLARKELPHTLKRNTNVYVLAFEKFYYLYLHISGTTIHELWKIDAEGDAHSFSIPFQNFIDTVLKGTAAACQLLNRNGHLVVLSHAYFDALKKVRTTITRFDSHLAPVQVKRALFPYDAANGSLHQVSLVGNDLLVLKTSRDEVNGRVLEIERVDLDSGVVAGNSFRAEAHVYINPVFRYNEQDSSVLLYSQLYGATESLRGQRVVFINRLNTQLQVIAPLTLLKRQFTNNTVSSYLWLDGKNPQWLAFFNNMRRPQQRARIYLPEQNNLTSYTNDITGNIWLRPGQSVNTASIQNMAVRFTLLNDQFKMRGDSVVANDKRYNDIQPNTFAQVTVQGKNCLVVPQNFSAKHQGLLLVYVNGKGQLLHRDIPVISQYDYNIPLTKKVDAYSFLFPYQHKKELGLVKIAYDDAESKLEN